MSSFQKHLAKQRRRENEMRNLNGDEEALVVVQKPQSNAHVPAVEKLMVSDARTISSSAISSNIKVDIHLETQNIGQLLDQTLKLTVNNTTNAAITVPLLAQETILSIKVLTQSGNHQLCEFTKDTLLFPLRYLTPSTLQRYKRGYVSDNAETIAVGAERSWYIPILGDVFAQNEVFMQAVQTGVIYRVEFDRSAWVDGFPELKWLSMYSRHLYYNNDIMATRKHADQNAVRFYNFRSYIVKNSDKIISAGADLTVKLDGFTRRASEIYLQLWKAGEHLEALGQYIDSYDITDAGNVSLLASQPVDSEYDDIILGAAHEIEPIIGLARDSWTIVSFTPENKDDFASGQVHGMHQFTGDEILKIKISNNLPSDGYQLRIYYGEINRMQSSGGIFQTI